MTQKIFTIHDVKAEVYTPPFCAPTRGIAIRAFTDCVNSDDHHFGQHPADYTLFYLGDFDPDTAEFDLPAPQSCGNGVEFVNPELKKPNGETRHVPIPTPIQPDQNG